jgi:DNA-binding XRE family transcriptional regulator
MTVRSVPALAQVLDRLLQHGIVEGAREGITSGVGVDFGIVAGGTAGASPRGSRSRAPAGPALPSTDLAGLVRCHHRPEMSTFPSMARWAAGDQTGPSRSSARDAPGVAHALQLLGKRVRALRLAGKLTQEQAAESAKLDEKHWQDIEGGRTNPTVASLVGVARALDVPLAKLFESGNDKEGSQAPSSSPASSGRLARSARSRQRR